MCAFKLVGSMFALGSAYRGRGVKLWRTFRRSEVGLSPAPPLTRAKENHMIKIFIGRALEEYNLHMEINRLKKDRDYWKERSAELQERLSDLKKSTGVRDARRPIHRDIAGNHNFMGD